VSSGPGIPYDKIKREFLAGDETLKSLAKIHGVSDASLYTRSKQEGWIEEREQTQAKIDEEARARIQAAAVEQRVRLYDATREAADKIIAAILRAAYDPEGFYKHVVQFEEEFEETTRANKDTPGHKQYSRKKWVDDKILTCLNGRNTADAARAIKDLSGIARILDGILEPRDQAKNDIERDKLDLIKQQAGMDDNREQECGIAIMPAMDKSLLDNALPDPDQLPGAPQEVKNG
jgi:hypothetical protein